MIRNADIMCNCIQKGATDTAVISGLKANNELKYGDKILANQDEPHLRKLQKTLAEELTTTVHSKEEYEMAVNASQILFGKATTENLKSINEKTAKLSSIFREKYI